IIGDQDDLILWIECQLIRSSSPTGGNRKGKREGMRKIDDLYRAAACRGGVVPYPEFTRGRAVVILVVPSVDCHDSVRSDKSRDGEKKLVAPGINHVNRGG